MTARLRSRSYKHKASRPRLQRSSFKHQSQAKIEKKEPGTWEEWKKNHPQWPRFMGKLEWHLEWLVYRCQDLAIFDSLELASRVSIIFVVFFWFWESSERTKQGHYQAWGVINSARGSTGDGGRRDALQDLNKDRVNLSDAPLRVAYLAGVQLPKARLAGADLREANLTRANLNGANLSKAILSKTILSKADLRHANLREANLIGAILNEVDLSEANLRDSKLSGTDLSGVKLSKANLSGVDLNVRNLRNADLSKADLRQASLIGADLRDAKLSGAELEWTDFGGADLSGADLSGAFDFPGSGDGTNIFGIFSGIKAIFCETTMPDGTLDNSDCPPEPPLSGPSETLPAPTNHGLCHRNP